MELPENVDLDLAAADSSITQNTGKALVQLNKKKYAVFREELAKAIPDESLQSIVLSTMCRAFGFNPDVRAYTPEEIKRKQEYHKRIAEERGVTLYEIKHKQYYEKHREEFIQKSNKCRKLRADALRQAAQAAVTAN